MKARVAKALDINNPEKELYCIMISQGRGKKSIPAGMNGVAFFTEDKALAKQKAKEFNNSKETHPRRQA